MKPPGSKTKTSVWVVENGGVRSRQDQLAVEEPLEIRLVTPQKTVAVTMRTPGADFDFTIVRKFCHNLPVNRLYFPVFVIN